jgi:hypothetical protein
MQTDNIPRRVVVSFFKIFSMQEGTYSNLAPHRGFLTDISLFFTVSTGKFYNSSS